MKWWGSHFVANSDFTGGAGSFLACPIVTCGKAAINSFPLVRMVLFCFLLPPVARPEGLLLHYELLEAAHSKI